MAEAAEIQGIPTAPLRRWLRRTTIALLATAPVLGALAPLPGSAPAAHAAPAAAPATRSADTEGSGSRTADLSVNTLTPSTPEKGDTLTVTGTVTNDSKTAITDGSVALRIGPSLGSRGAIGQAAERESYLSGADGSEIGGKRAEKVGTLQPGISRSFTLKVPVSQLKLSRDGVYQVGVSLTGKTSKRPYDQLLGITRSFLPWQESASREKTRMTYLWPLVSTPHLTARTESDEQQTPVFRDDELARDLAPGGRLQQMVTLGKDLPVTWVIDPDLLATVDAMTKRYRVQDEDGGTVAGKGQEYAKQWLMDLQDAVKGEEVAALPFGDPDLASLAHRGKSVPGALSNLGPATELASDTVETILHTRPRTDFAWPVDGAVDSSIVDVATSAGAHNVIARGDSIRDTALSYAPTAARPIGGGNTALVADTGLSKAFAGDMSRAGASSKAVQRFLAETLAITAQAPTKQRSIVVAPQRMPTASQAQAMATALSSLDQSGLWTEGQDLSDAAKAKPDPNANTRVPGSGSYPSALRKQELPTEAYERVQQTEATLEDFKQVLTRGDRVVTPFGTAIDRAVSTSWRGDAKGGTEYRESVQSYLIGLTKKVHLIQKSPITLSGRSATIPVTVQNNLVQEVDGLELRLKSSRRIGLDVGQSQPVKVDGGHSQSVKFTTSAKANGRSFVEAQLYTKDGKPYGKPMRFRVNVTSITSAVLLVIAGGVLLVVLAGIRMYTQRKRRTGPPVDPDAPLEPADSGSGSDSDGSGSDGSGTDPGAGPGTDGPGGTGGPDRSGGSGGTGGSGGAGTGAPDGRGDDQREDEDRRPEQDKEHAGHGSDRGDTGPESGARSAAGEKVNR
ncbi:DUF6049 family protein [Streptomyces sp. NPDC054796]